MKRKNFNYWTFGELNRRQIFIGLILFIGSGYLFRWLGNILWRKKNIVNRDKISTIRSKINELTIQELNRDIKALEDRVEILNNEFLTEGKGILENSERFTKINKLYLELRLRLNHIDNELEKKVNKRYKDDKVTNYGKRLLKVKGSLNLLNDELSRETEEMQSSKLHMLTLIETIFLPLGVLTGYFGMNFSSMGGHVGIKHKPAPGILGLKYGQGLVWVIIIICVIIVLRYFNLNKEGYSGGSSCAVGKNVVAFNNDTRELNDIKENYEI
jgi:Mg2+ and Co2+ transporter CorA